MSEAHVQARREQILDAALRSFGRNGFHATTMQDVATEAGLSPGALYRYFPGKTDLVAALAKQHRERNLAIFATADAGAETATMFRHLGEAFFRQFEEPDFADWLPINIELWAESIRSTRCARSCANRWRPRRRWWSSWCAARKPGATSIRRWTRPRSFNS